jgi:GNAT superfamily N-acetyltransferase
MIERVKLTDWGDILPLAREFHQASPVYQTSPFDGAVFWSTFWCCCQDEERFGGWVVRRGEGEPAYGGMLAALAPSPFSRKVAAVDLGLFIRPDMRGGMGAVRLVRAFQEWASAHNARAVVGVTAGVDDDAAIRLYRRLGFRTIGQTLAKEM